MIILAISEGALRSSIFFRRGSQDLCVDSHMVLPFVCWCPALLCTSISYRSVVQNSEWIPESSARSLYTLALNPPPVCRPLSDVTGMRERGSGCYRLPHMYVCVGGGTDMEICKATCETLVFWFFNKHYIALYICLHIYIYTHTHFDIYIQFDNEDRHVLYCSIYLVESEFIE